MEQPGQPKAKTGQQSVLLLDGLPDIMLPSQARQTLNSSTLVAGLPENQVKGTLRATALRVCAHERFSQSLVHLMTEGTNTPLFFLCAVHGLEVPSADDALALPNLGGDRELPLCHWEGLYLALVAEIRIIYAKLGQIWDTELQHGQLVLHSRGPEGTRINEPFTAHDLAKLLRFSWFTLMETKLLGVLEQAIRKEHVAQGYRKKFGDAHYRQYMEEDWSKWDEKTVGLILDDTEGMMNPHVFSPERVVQALWHEYMPSVQLACQEILRVDVDYVARHSQLVEVTEAIGNQTVVQTNTPANDDRLCSCNEDCSCYVVCQYDHAGTCPCKGFQGPWRTTADEQSADTANSPTQQQRETTHRQYNIFEAPSSQISQLQIATRPRTRNPQLIKAAEEMKKVSENRVANAYGNRRERSNTENSELKYVPSTSKRGTKDPYPLGYFGGSRSPGRFPPFHHREDRPPTPPPKNEPRRVMGPSAHKKVPSTSSSLYETSPMHDPGLSISPEYVSTFLSSPEPQTPDDNKPNFSSLFGPKGRVPMTDIFDMQNAGHLRAPSDDFNEWDTSNVATPTIPPQRSDDEAHSSGISQGGRRSESTARPSRKPLPLSRTRTADPADLPLPDFITPRPALASRYVSAGGATKLYDREEVPFEHKKPTEGCFNMSAEEAMSNAAKLFPPMIRSSGDTAPRGSQDSITSVGDTGRNEKRNRTESSTSQSSAKQKIKRFFSRQHSSSQ